MKKHLAIDIGASGGRHIIGYLSDGKLIQREVYRFDNGADKLNDSLIWDIDRLFYHIKQGLKECKLKKLVPDSVGIDMWGVDYVLLNSDNDPILPAYCYRDSRTKKFIDTIVPHSKMFTSTGTAFNEFNTVYQLLADKADNRLQKANSMLMLPEYFSFLLTGKKAREYTLASTTGLLDATTRKWDLNLIEELGLDKKLFNNKELKDPGFILGDFTNDIAKEVGFNATVIFPAMHDTASAVVAVVEENQLYISSGTWSLLGIETEPILTEKARASGYSNEGALNNKIRFQKNIMGLWVIQQVKKELDNKYSYSQLVTLAENETEFSSYIDINKQEFFSPKSMIDAIKQECKDTNQSVPTSAGELAKCVYLSLAYSYKNAVLDLQEIVAKKFNSINIIGGGANNKYLNELIYKITGLKVIAGPNEATSTGNLLVQMMSLDKTITTKKTKEIIKYSFKFDVIED